MVTVIPALIPDAKWLVQISDRRAAVKTMMQIDHITPLPSALSHCAIRSWLNAMRTKGMEMAAEIETFKGKSD
jgi:hypothetical protein